MRNAETWIMFKEKRPLDEMGWKIPSEGTLSKRVYDLVKAGKTKMEIAEELDKPTATVGGIVAYFMPPKPRQEHASPLEDQPAARSGVYHVYEVDLATGESILIRKFRAARNANRCVMDVFRSGAGSNILRLVYSNGRFGAGAGGSGGNNDDWFRAQEIVRSAHRGGDDKRSARPRD